MYDNISTNKYLVFDFTYILQQNLLYGFFHMLVKAPRMKLHGMGKVGATNYEQG